ncbi:MAG TPA: FAD-dependent oxidoreductase [Candidatus Paceibacterota bacterium]|nr:FAD-dependent oxidoreductase [Candidatus Paceibacterota bacterium]
MYELIIIGGGPAGVAAGVYAARKKIKTLIITDSFGGQSFVSAGIENWIGIKLISGFDLAKALEEHIRAQEDIDIEGDDKVESVQKTQQGFSITTKAGKKFETKYIFMATGSQRRKLDVPGEKGFEGKGVVYCSICDAPLFKGKDVAVIGTGNAGLEAVIDLFPYAEKIYLFSRSEKLRGDEVTQEKVLSNPKVKLVTMTEIISVEGKDFVTGIQYKDKETGEAKIIPVGGVFVEIGAVPSSDLVKDIVKLDSHGNIIVDHRTQQSSDPGIWAAGDVTDVLYKQNNISAGDAVKAILNIDDRIHKNKG